MRHFILNWLRWKLCGRELEAYERLRIDLQTTRQWCSEFDEVGDTLDWIASRNGLNKSGVSYNPVPTGMDISMFREWLRRRRKERVMYG